MFDGVRHSMPALVPTVSYAPHNGYDADLFFAALVSSYFEARNGCRRLFAQTWPWNGRSVGPADPSARRFYTSATELYSNEAYIDDRWTHATVIFLFAAWIEAVAYARFSIDADDGTTTETGDVTDKQLEIGSFTSAAPTVWTPDIRNDPQANHFIQCEVTLGNLDLNQAVELTFSGFVNLEVFLPLHLLIALEVRE